MFKQFSDAELVIMWHRINQGIWFYEDYVSTSLDKDKIETIERKHKRSLWKKINCECHKREINVFTLTKTTPVEVITYKNKEVDIG